jgi:hypothetical protein
VAADQANYCAFVCYAQDSVEDAQFAQRLMADLREAGIDVVNRENRQEGAMAELQESQWVILVQTPAAQRSPQVQFTIDAALDLVQQQRMHGVLSMIAASHSLQDIPPTWSTLKTFDDSEDYAKAFARLLLALNPVLSVTVPSTQMRTVPPPAFQPMTMASVQSAMEADDKPARFMPLWLRKKQLKSWLVPLSAVLALILVGGCEHRSICNDGAGTHTTCCGKESWGDCDDAYSRSDATYRSANTDPHISTYANVGADPTSCSNTKRSYNSTDPLCECDAGATDSDRSSDCSGWE